jgi:hypothetical protein
LAHPKVGLQKTNLHEAVVCPRVLHLAFSLWKVHNNPEAAIRACANKLDNMEPYGRIPMLTHASHGTRPGNQKLSRKQPSVNYSMFPTTPERIKILNLVSKNFRNTGLEGKRKGSSLKLSYPLP